MAGLAGLALLAGACGSSSHAAVPSGDRTSPPVASSVTVHLGLFPNITHAPALVGLDKGFFAKALGSDKLATPLVFSAGPAENSALLSGSIDLAFEGPSSALSAYSSSHGAVVVVAGVASGGAGLVVKKSITSPAQLKGTKLGTPQLANTQDIALRYWLKQHGLTSTTTGGGDVSIEPSSTGSGTIVTEYESGGIDGAWMAEPYEQELIAAGGHLLTAESGATTDLVVRKAFLAAHPTTVSHFIRGLLTTLAYMKSDKAAAQAAANSQLGKLEGGKPLATSVLDAAWDNITFGDNPDAAGLATQVDQGVAVGLLTKPADISGIFDLGPLNAVLASEHLAKVPS